MSKVRIGMIGCGGIARWHMALLAQISEAEVTALADPDSSQIERSLRQHPHLVRAATFQDHREMLEACELDGVVISTPHTQHLSQIRDCFEAGLHVMCEKPLATTVDDAKAAIEARDRAGKIGLLAYQRHTQAEYKLIKERIGSGDFGKVQFVSAVQSQDWRKLTVGTWRQDPLLSGGGQLGDSGSHVVDILMWVADLEPEQVVAYAENRGTPVDINAALAIRFQDGAMGNISIIGDAQAWHEDVTIWCDKGAFFIRDNQLTIMDENGSRFLAQDLRGGSNPDQNFVGAILNREEVLSPFECGLRVIQLTQAAWESAAEGGLPVKVADLG
jgi:predicted dehydrogenase